MATSNQIMIQIFVLITVLTPLVSYVAGHGSFVSPAARGTCNSNSINNASPRNPRIAEVYQATRDSRCAFAGCPHCLNAGGVGAVSTAAGGEWSPYEPLNNNVPFRRDFGLCGDSAAGDKPHQKGGIYAYPQSPIFKTYKTGDKVQFVIDVTTNHNGYFEFFICDATKCDGDINEQCFKNGNCFQLNRVANTECESQNSLECAPIDKVYPGRWYVPCRKSGEHFMGGPFMEYQLPSGFSSDHAVIQWYWVTANSCNPPGFVEYFEKYSMPGWGQCSGDGGAIGGRNPSLQTCGGGNFPEEFWNCADVTVNANGQASVADSPQPSPSSGQTGGNTNQPTSTPTPTRSLAPTPSPQTGNDQPSCAVKWAQCGGKFHTGPSDCCESDYSCIFVNEYYSQCRKVDGN